MNVVYNSFVIHILNDMNNSVKSRVDVRAIVYR